MTTNTDPKPPLCVWLWPLIPGKGVGRYGDRYETADGCKYTTGPYVNLAQLEAMVEERKKSDKYRKLGAGNLALAFSMAMRDTIAELKKGKQL